MDSWQPARAIFSALFFFIITTCITICCLSHPIRCYGDLRKTSTAARSRRQIYTSILASYATFSTQKWESDAVVESTYRLARHEIRSITSSSNRERYYAVDSIGPSIHPFCTSNSERIIHCEAKHAPFSIYNNVVKPQYILIIVDREILK